MEFGWIGLGVAIGVAISQGIDKLKEKAEKKIEKVEADLIIESQIKELVKLKEELEKEK
tara:strand:- start:284 stop:460 length:177 start_codon:yes stop_codon:yes gene_type:complete